MSQSKIEFSIDDVRMMMNIMRAKYIKRGLTTQEYELMEKLQDKYIQMGGSI